MKKYRSVTQFVKKELDYFEDSETFYIGNFGDINDCIISKEAKIWYGHPGEKNAYLVGNLVSIKGIIYKISFYNLDLYKLDQDLNSISSSKGCICLIAI